jgi:hypothetical protein
MKNYLSKSFIFIVSIISLTYAYALAQPIQLVPQKEGSSSSLDPLPLTQEVKGLWEGTPSSLMETYFAKLPLSLSSPVLRAFRDQILKDKYEPLLQNSSYQQALFSQLKESGQFEQAKELLSESSVADKDVLLIDLQWLMGEQKKACEKITNLIRTSPSSEWKKQNIYCLYLNGEGERGKIAAELYVESHSPHSTLLNTLFDSSSPPPFDEAIGNSPFLLTVWCAIGLEIPKGILKTLPLSSLALITKSEKMPFSTRLSAGQIALQGGLLSGEYLLNLLKNPTSDELLEKFAHELKSPQSESLLPLFERASQEQKLGIVGEVFKPLLSHMNPSQETLSLAPYMVRAFLESGEKNLAQKWGSFLMREDPDQAISLLPLLHLAFPQNKWGETQLQAWQTYQSRAHPETASQHSYELRRILEALGEPPGAPLKGEPSTPSWRMEKALFDEKTLDLLNAAASSHRKGEVLLFTLLMMGDTPLKDLSADKFTRFLSILHKAGFTNEARSLALEYLLSKFS